MKRVFFHFVLVLCVFQLTELPWSRPAAQVYIQDHPTTQVSIYLSVYLSIYRHPVAQVYIQDHPAAQVSIYLSTYLSSPSCPGVYTGPPSCPGIYLSIVAQLPRCIYRITQLPRYLSNYLLSPSCPGVPEKDLGRRDLTGVARLFGWPVGQGSQSHPRTHGPPPARRSPRRRPRRTSPRRRRRGPRGSQQTRCEKREAGCAARGQRSEERRVGKECRSRWSPYH